MTSGRILRERAKITRAAEAEGRDVLTGWPALPTTVPDWFDGVRDGEVTQHVPAVPMPRRNEDGTVTLELAMDAITGRASGPALRHPEESLPEGKLP